VTNAEFALLTTLEFDMDVPHPNLCFKALIDALGVCACCSTCMVPIRG
jgi:predicted molibdopterin-dependent oxidoreductase YjgC